MELEGITKKYMVAGVILLLVTVMIQEAPRQKDKFEDELFGDYITDKYPDLVLQNGAGYGAASYIHTDTPFSYSGHYLPENRFIASTDGIIMLRAKNKNFLRKRYSRVPNGSDVVVEAYNDIYFTPGVNRTMHCDSINVTVSMDDKKFRRINVSKTDSLESYRFEAPTRGETKFELRATPSQGCGNMPQQAGIDSFYLEIPDEEIPGNPLGKLLYRFNP